MSATEAAPAQRPLARDLWHIAYALLGFVQTGLAPILLPLAAGRGAEAGLVYGAFAAAGLTAPMLGAYSDRTRSNRVFFVGGLLLAGFAMISRPLLPGLIGHIALAFAAGLGTMAASTSGTMLAVENVPDREWDAQIGSLQGFGAGGQVAGLLAGGALAITDPLAGFLLGGAALLAAAALAAAFAPRSPRQVHRRAVIACASPGGEAATASPGGHLHQAGHRGWAPLQRAVGSPLGRFLLV